MLGATLLIVDRIAGEIGEFNSRNNLHLPSIDSIAQTYYCKGLLKVNAFGGSHQFVG